MVRRRLFADLHLDVLEWLRGVLVELLLGPDHRLAHVTFALDLMGRLSVSSQVDLSLERFLAQAARERFVASVLSHVSNSVETRREGRKRENEFACHGVGLRKSLTTYRFDDWLKALRQTGHLCGFSPV
jgi:hypothetical protein